MLEHYRQPLLPKEKFFLRLARNVIISLLLLVATILFGTIVFHFAEKLSWIDAYLNSVMIMTGVGTVSSINTAFGKLFTGIYSILSTFIFFAILAIIATPILHRLLHKFHLDIKD
ncbi:MAG: hypothetical protein PHO03_00755 [Candidatus Omnitrophica bacterium]|nr:hypothetical protein [Candidatus Omnitrophota bacterium]